MPRRGVFCYVCGKVTEELIKGRCKACYYEEAELLRLPEELQARVCRDCASYFKNGRWLCQDDLEGAVEQAARSAIMGSLVLKNLALEEVGLSLGAPEGRGEKKILVPYTLRVAGVHQGDKYSVEKKGVVLADVSLCDSCAKRKSRYYEAVLQVRGRGQDKVKNIAIEHLEGLRSKDPGAFVSDLKNLKTGVDLYIGSLRAARKVASFLAERHGGLLKESPKLVGRSRNGKDLYRVNISLRLPRFGVDDVLRVGKKKLQVGEFKGNKVIVRDIESRERRAVPLKSLNKAVVLRRKSIPDWK